VGFSSVSEWERFSSVGLHGPGTTWRPCSACRHSADNSKKTWTFCTVCHGISFEEENRSCW